MPSESEDTPQTTTESVEKQLCVCCMFPNEASANFCAKCGAPITSYAATGPFESLFAEGHVYRQAVEKPRRFVVVLGIWIIFGMMALAGGVLLFIGGELGGPYAVAGIFFLVISLLMIWKSTRSYSARIKVGQNRADQD